MKTLSLLFASLTITLSAHADFQKISGEQAKQIPQMIDHNLNPDELVGTWKRVLAVPTNEDDSNLAYSNDDGLANVWDGSQNTITIVKTGSAWLPTGENTDYQITENNIVSSDYSFNARISIVGDQLKYTRPSYAVEYSSSCRDPICYNNGGGPNSNWDTYSEARLFDFLPSEKDQVGADFQKQHYYSSHEMIENGSAAVSCGLMNNDHNRLVCTITGDSQNYLSAVTGYVRVPAASK